VPTALCYISRNAQSHAYRIVLYLKECSISCLPHCVISQGMLNPVPTALCYISRNAQSRAYRIVLYLKECSIPCLPHWLSLSLIYVIENSRNIVTMIVIEHVEPISPFIYWPGETSSRLLLYIPAGLVEGVSTWAAFDFEDRRLLQRHGRPPQTNLFISKHR